MWVEIGEKIKLSLTTTSPPLPSPRVGGMESYHCYSSAPKTLTLGFKLTITFVIIFQNSSG